MTPSQLHAPVLPPRVAVPTPRWWAVAPAPRPVTDRQPRELAQRILARWAWVR